MGGLSWHLCSYVFVYEELSLLHPHTPKHQSQSTMATSPASDSRLLGGLLDKIDTRWKNWFIRGVFSIIMISFFSIITYLGPFVLSLLVGFAPGREWRGEGGGMEGGRREGWEGEGGKGFISTSTIPISFDASHLPYRKISPHLLRSLSFPR